MQKLFAVLCVAPALALARVQYEGADREQLLAQGAKKGGLADSDAKRTISNQEMGRRIRSWQK